MLQLEIAHAYSFQRRQTQGVSDSFTASAMRIIMLHSLRIFLICYLLCLFCGEACADAVHFTVTEISGPRVLLRADGTCSPGTLVNFDKTTDPENSHIVTLQITGHRSDTRYTAIAFLDEKDTQLLRIGDQGKTNSPLHSYEPMTVGIKCDDTNVIDSIKSQIRDAPVEWVDPSRITPDTLVEISSRAKPQFTLTTPFLHSVTTAISDMSNAMMIESICRVLRTDASAYFWLSLNNHYEYSMQKGNGTWLSILNNEDFAAPGKFKRGKPIALRATPSMDGYACLLSPDIDGHVIVLYPNSATSANKRVTAHSFFEVYQLVKLTATSLGLTHLVMLISKMPRPLSDFLPAHYHASYYDYTGGTQISPSSIGPGFLRQSTANIDDSNHPNSPDDLPADSWDIGALTFDVVSP